MKQIISVLISTVLIVIGSATFVERMKGTPYVEHAIYGSLWFTALWFVLAMIGLIYIVKRKLYVNIPAFVLHLSFILILIGAFITSSTALKGEVHLSPGDEMSMFTASTDKKCDYRDMPVILRLEYFEIQYYPGTKTPKDFVDHLQVTDKVTGKSFRYRISMNRILSYKGYRFYQSSYNLSNMTSTLTVYSDPWGITVTYIGYILLFVSFLSVLFNPRGSFRKLLENPLLKQAAFFVFLFFGSSNCFAAEKVLPREQATELSRLQVLYNGRITPLQTLAYDFTRKIVGKGSYRKYSPEQIFSGWLFWPDSWENEPMIKIKRNRFCTEREIFSPAKFSDFFTSDGEYKLDDYWKQRRMINTSDRSVINDIDEKIQLISMLRQKTLLKIFPYTEKGNTTWYAAADSLPQTLPPLYSLFIKNIIGLLMEAVEKQDFKRVSFIIDKLYKYQKINGGTSYLSREKVRAEMFYNRIPFTTILYRMNLLLGLFSLIFCFRKLLFDKPCRSCKIVSIISFILLICSFLFLSVELVLRMYIGSRLPMTNGYETMVLLAWCIMLTAILFHRKMIFISSFGLLLSGFCLLVASLGKMNPQITNLVPVLNSPILSFHVSLIMMSYALLGFTFLNGMTSLLLYRMRRSEKAFEQIEILEIVSRVFLYPALALLGSGIFVGAIWANLSWGRYWSWDPKEVWALISFIFYAAALHEKSMPMFRKPLFFHIYMVIAFSTILMTYFGVNYFLGGMHSYANN